MTDLISGEDIQKILHSTGPIVKCVLLRATRDPVDPESDSKLPAKPDSDEKQPAEEKEAENPAAKEDTEKGDSVNENESSAKEEGEKVILKHLIDEIEVDTTPKKSMVAQVLGGPITFLGQYEDEDLVIVCRRPESMENDAPWNPHKLQPPFEDAQVQGDILIMKVTPEAEQELEGTEPPPPPAVSTNDEFFLDFTKDEYIAFAMRDDVEPPETEEQVEDEEEEELEEDDDDEEYIAEDDDDADDDDEEAQVAMMNLIMGQVLRRFHEENGRGPDTRELLELRSALAQKIGVEVPEIVAADWDKKASDNEETEGKPSGSGKRSAEDVDKGSASDDHEAKRVKFSQEEEAAGEAAGKQHGSET